MKKAAIYMRVSTAGQEKEETIDNQKMELEKRIIKDKVTLLPECVYQDNGWSGSILERPGLDQMRTDAEADKFEVLYVYDRGRLARRYVYQEIILDGIRKKDIDFISLHDINGDSNEEILMGGVMGIFHEYERLKITERMRIGKIRRVQGNNKLLGYQPKYGYDYNPRIKKGNDARDGYFSINKIQAKVVKDIFEWSASGMSKYMIRDELHRQNTLPQKNKKEIWSTSVIDRMIRDTTYTGNHYYNKTESVETKKPRTNNKYRRVIKGSRIARPKEDWMLIKVPPIISLELFTKVQVQLERNKRTSQRNNSKNNYLLGGLIECPCGFARTGDPTGTNLYYRCTDRLNNACGTRKCHEMGVNTTVLDKLVWKNLKQLIICPELLFEQAKKWQSSVSPQEKQLVILKEQINKLNERQERYMNLYSYGDLPAKDYRNRKYEIETDRNKILNEISIIENELKYKPSLPLEKLVDGVVKLVEDLDFSDKKQIVQKLITKVIATKKEVTVWGYIPVLATEKIGLDVKYRNRRPTKCR